jgi:anti-sigma factor RsiW
LVTCKQLLDELNDFLDEALDGMTRRELEQHLGKCPNCQVLVDTTKKTIRVFRGLEPCQIPFEVETRLLAAIERKSHSVGRARTS